MTVRTALLEARPIAGDEALFGDHWADAGEVTSGDGDDKCSGGAGTDSAASCEAITGVP